MHHCAGGLPVTQVLTKDSVLDCRTGSYREVAGEVETVDSLSRYFFKLQFTFVHFVSQALGTTSIASICRQTHDAQTVAGQGKAFPSEMPSASSSIVTIRLVAVPEHRRSNMIWT